MDPIALTRRLVDIPSVTGEEGAVGDALSDLVGEIAKRYGGQIEEWEVTPGRRNVFACWGATPTVTFSTHMDTVPPFIPSSEDDEFVYGRGACDAKGILAAMIAALENLLREGVRGLGLLIVVGEERGSDGALAAGTIHRGSNFLINGEPTENKLALGMKGALRLEVMAEGKMAHSAYPELGISAIDALLDFLDNARHASLPYNEVLGQSTLNIGTIKGGRAPNVIPDQAFAELLIRLVDDGDSTAAQMQALAETTNGASLEVKEVLRIGALRLTSVPGFDTTSVAYTTDIPPLLGAWGKPLLLGPGSIHMAHTDHERVAKAGLREAVALYERLGRELLGAVLVAG